MTLPRLTKLELQIMETLWSRGALSVREIQEVFAERDRPAYTTVQTMVYRLESKKAIRRVKKIGNAHIFEPLVSRQSAIGSLIEDFLGHFAGSHEPLVAHLVETGRISSAELKQMEKLLRERRGK